MNQKTQELDMTLPAETLGSRLKALRGEKSREEFASYFGIHAQTLRKYEIDQRTPGADFLKDVCERLTISPAWLLMGEGEMKPQCPDQSQDDQPASDAPSRTVGDISLMDHITEELKEMRSECTTLRFENKSLRKENNELLKENKTMVDLLSDWLREITEVRASIPNQKQLRQ